ncbi:hypothetical protein [Aureimonas sp. AU40]|uniref:hypothetical protein n=1 Tax=Aureimonas sp. AU40 TaxID=1637747 RepID=UPI0007854E77|nr:hypothetical protein [Aureimonas sp. AU40]
MSRLLAAAEFLRIADRPDVCLALEEAHAEPAEPSWLVKRTFYILALWPLLVETHAQATCRHDYGPSMHGDVLDALNDVLGVGDGTDPLPAVAALSGELTGYAMHVADASGAPHETVLQCVTAYGRVYGEQDWMRVDWHRIDPNGELATVCHRDLKKIARRFMALADLPDGRRERVSAVAKAIVDMVVLQRIRDAI